MAASNFTLVLEEGITFIFSSWVCITNSHFVVSIANSSTPSSRRYQHLHPTAKSMNSPIISANFDFPIESENTRVRIGPTRLLLMIGPDPSSYSYCAIMLPFTRRWSKLIFSNMEKDLEDLLQLGAEEREATTCREASMCDNYSDPNDHIKPFLGSHYSVTRIEPIGRTLASSPSREWKRKGKSKGRKGFFFA